MGKKREYRVLYQQSGAGDYAGIPMSALDAYSSVGMSAILHGAVGWDVRLCPSGFHATRGDLTRSEHVVPVEAEDERDVPATFSDGDRPSPALAVA